MREISIFATIAGIEEMVLNNFGREEYSDVYKEVSKSKITINEEGELVFKEKQNPDSLLFNLINSFPAIEVKGCVPIELTTESYTEIIHNKGFDIVLVESHTENLAKIDAYTGVYVLHPETESFAGILSLNYTRDIVKDQEYSIIDPDRMNHIGWSCILKDITLKPANSLVIQDNYIFSNNPKTFVSNTLRIIEKFLHPELKIPFELLIVSLNGSNEQRPWYEDILAKLVEEVRGKINLNFEAGILIHPFKDEHHKRLLISNLSLSKSDWGYNAFKHSKSYHDNDIHIRGLFHTNNNCGDSPLCTFNHEIEKIKTTLRRIKSAEDSGLPDSTRMTIGNCDNRLLKKV